MDWKKIVGTVAPTLATALGGPLAGMATREISAKLGLSPDAKEDQVAAAIAGAKPEDLVKLRELDAQFKEQMAQLGVQLEQIEAADRADARKRQIATQDWTPNVLAIAILVGFFVVQIYMLGHQIMNSELVMRGMGTFDALLVMVFSYFFGSSRSSRQKDEVLGRVAERK